VSASEPAGVAAVLGPAVARQAKTPLELAAFIERGLPLGVVSTLAAAVAPADADFKNRFVPRATLARRKRDKARLTPTEGDRVARVARLWARALQVWKSEHSAREFLFRPHPMLEGRLPIDAALGTEIGAELVDQILGRLEHGTAA
jgi:putative toxin-antitoxin system antitoxin component (TIGR02293 family)